MTESTSTTTKRTLSGHWPSRRGRSPREPRKTSFVHDWPWRWSRIVVHVNYEKHRLFMIDLGDNAVIYVDYAEHRLVVIDVWEEVIDYMNYAEIIAWSWHVSETTSSSIRRLSRASSGHDRSRRWRHRPRRLSGTSFGHDWPWRWPYRPHGLGKTWSDPDWPWRKRPRPRGYYVNNVVWSWHFSEMTTSST